MALTILLIINGIDNHNADDDDDGDGDDDQTMGQR